MPGKRSILPHDSGSHDASNLLLLHSLSRLKNIQKVTQTQKENYKLTNTMCA